MPFTYVGIVRAAFGEMLLMKRKISVLDLGCGDGSNVWNLNLPKNFEITGVDIFKPYLELAKKRGIYKKLIRGDVMRINTRRKFDIVIASHILEHFEKSRAIKFLIKAEALASKKVIIVTPIGEHPQESYDNNKYQEHKSSWEVSEMKNLGYKVKAQGLKFLWGNADVIVKYNIFSYLFFMLSNLLYPILLIKPGWGTYMICTKNK